jgi:hypothetical protein
LLLLLLCVVAGVLVVVLREEPPPPPPPPSLPAPEPPPPPPPEPLPPPVVVEPPKPKPAKAAAPTPAAPRKTAAAALGATVAVGGAVGGDPHVRKAMERALRGRLGAAEVPMSEATYSVTVQVDDQKANANEVTVRCALSIALLPKKNIVASLKARADAAGEGTPTEELLDDAATACGQSLASDLRSWLKSHPG